MNCRLFILLLLLVARAHGQMVYVEIRGVVESSSTTTFAAGHSYSFTLAYDLSAVPTVSFSTTAVYEDAAQSIVFNYDAGQYVGVATNLAIWTQNAPTGDGFAVGFPSGGSVGFAPVDGYSFFTGAGTPMLDLFDPTGAALGSAALFNLAAAAPAFLNGADDRLRLRWGSVGDEVLFVATVDSISTFDTSAIAEPGLTATLMAAAAFAFTAIRRRTRNAERPAGRG